MKFHEKLSSMVNQYAHSVYKVTRKFPSEEKYGLTSQFRRAAVSVALNYTEGFARVSRKVNKNFLEIAYGSLKETRFLINFTFEEGLINNEERAELDVLCDEIGAMLWTTMQNIRN